MGERRWKTSGSSISRVVFGIFNVLLIVPGLLDLHVSYSWKTPLSDCIERGTEGVRCVHSAFITFIPLLKVKSPFPP